MDSPLLEMRAQTGEANLLELGGPAIFEGLQPGLQPLALLALVLHHSSSVPSSSQSSALSLCPSPLPSLSPALDPCSSIPTPAGPVACEEARRLVSYKRLPHLAHPSELREVGLEVLHRTRVGGARDLLQVRLQPQGGE